MKCRINAETQAHPAALPSSSQILLLGSDIPSQAEDRKCLQSKLSDLEKTEPENPDTGDFPTKEALLVTVLES